MKLTQVAAQLYTCRDLLQTPSDIAVTLRRIRQIGLPVLQAGAALRSKSFQRCIGLAGNTQQQCAGLQQLFGYRQAHAARGAGQNGESSLHRFNRQG